MEDIEHKICDLLIIGCGSAGMMSAVYASRAGLKTLILESTGAGGQILSTSEIDNFPAFISITGAELAMKMNEQVEHCGVETIYDEIVSVSFKKAQKIIKCKDTEIKAKAVIIATGASPRKIGCNGEEKFLGQGIHFCALCDGAFYKNKDIIIAGGGNSAIEEALYMSPIAKSITIVNLMPSFTAFASSIEKLENLSNVTVKHNMEITKFIGNEKLESIEVNNKEIIPCDGVFVAIGRAPNTDFLKKSVQLSKGGYIVVNNKMQARLTNTNENFEEAPCGIFAAGDVCEKYVRQIVTACADGAIAATHATEYIRSLGIDE